MSVTTKAESACKWVDVDPTGKYGKYGVSS